MISQFIGIRSIPIGIGTILLLPMLFAFAMALLLNPNIIGAAAKIMQRAAPPPRAR